MAQAIQINFLHWVGKAWVYIRTHVQGEHVEAAASSQIEQWSHPLTVLLGSAVGSKAAAILASNPTITEVAFAAELTPELDTIITGVVDGFGLIPAEYKSGAVSFLEKIAPSVIQQVFNQVAAQIKNTEASAPAPAPAAKPAS